jgi:hypothetical protein
MANPLVRQLGLQAILNRDAAAAPEPQAIDETSSMSALASHVRAAWGRNKLSKERISLKLLDCLRARRGVYSPAQLQVMMSNGGGMNIVWADLTETKCRAASAWIREIVLPVGEQPWGIDPTPLPDLPKALKQSIVTKALEQAKQVMIQAAQASAPPEPDPNAPPGAPPPPSPTTMTPGEFRDLVISLGEKLRDEAERTVSKIAAARAKRMEKQIADRLAQGGYAQAMDAFVEDFCTYPAAILKGPIYTRHKTLKWADGWNPQVSNNPAQTWSHVSPFDVYPAAASRSPQEGDFIERIRFRRDELFDLKGLPDYKDDEIDAALRDYSGGHLEGWLWTEAERQRLEQETMYMWLSPPGVIDALNYWGGVPGWKLKSWGVQGNAKTGELEDTRDYECNVLICGKYILYAALNPDPLDKRPYLKACYDEIPGAFWGRSIPDLASTHQKMCNGIACALADNLAMASGPMVWVHADRFADGESTIDIFPWKTWQLKSDPSQGVNPGIGFFQADDRSGPLMATYEQWERRADDATGIPRYTYGNEQAGGSADTATGLSMLMNNAAKGLRRAISNIDLNVIAPTIEQTFTNEMLYNPDDSIKGDCITVPRGAAAILIKESAQQRRTQFLGMTGNPIDMQIIGLKGRAALLRETASAMELPVDDIVPSEEEMEQKEAAQAQAAQAQAQAQAQAGQAQEQAIAQRESQGRQEALIADIVKQVIAAKAKPPAPAAGPPTGQRQLAAA